MTARRSFRSALALLIAGLVAAVILTFGLAAYRAMRSFATVAAENRLVAVARQLADMLSTSAVTLRTSVAATAQDPALSAYLQTPTRSSAGAALAAIRPLATRAGTTSVEVWNSDAARVLTTAPGTSELKRAELRELVASQSDRDSPALTPLRLRGDSVTFAVVSRVKRGSETVGYLVVGRRLTSASKEAAPLRALFGSDMRILLGNARGDVWSDGTRAVAGPPPGRDSSAVVRHYERAGIGPTLSAAAPIRTTPWRVVIEEPQAGILQGLNESMQQLGLFATAVLLLAVLTGLMLTARFVRPLSELAHAAEAISRGDYTSRMTTNHADEIGALAVAFNQMGDSVMGAYAALEAKAAEAATSERRLRRLVTSSGVVLYELRIKRDTFVPEWISDNITKLLGYTVDEAKAILWWSENLHPDDRARVTESRWTSLNRNTVDEYRLKDKSGRYRWIRDDRRTLRERDPGIGEVTRVIGAWSDITEQRQLEDQVRHAQKMEAIGTLAGGVAHDFNNLLTVISSYTQLLLAGEHSDADRADLEEIATAAQRGTALTRQLLTFSRKAIVQRQPVNLSDVVHGMEGMFRRLLTADVELVTKTRDDLSAVLADRSQVEQVLMNLVVNAADAMPNGGTLVIETEHVDVDDAFARTHAGLEPGSYVMLAVTDSGIGMDATTQSKIFEPFFTTKPVGRGTGLGLATVYAIVKELGGQIWVYSEPGNGAAFKIYLPRSQAAGAERATPPAAVRASHAGTALLVEDDEHVRRAVRRMLQRIGYRVLEASDGADGLAVAGKQRGRIDLVVTDLMMPRMNGSEFVEALGRTRPDVRVIFTSGYTSDGVMRRGLLNANHTFLQKPFSSEQLVAAIAQVANVTV